MPKESIKRSVRIEAQFFWKISYKHKNSIKLDDNLNKREKGFFWSILKEFWKTFCDFFGEIFLPDFVVFILSISTWVRLSTWSEQASNQKVFAL